jgi:hypothetical protein
VFYISHSLGSSFEQVGPLSCQLDDGLSEERVSPREPVPGDDVRIVDGERLVDETVAGLSLQPFQAFANLVVVV